MALAKLGRTELVLSHFDDATWAIEERAAALNHACTRSQERAAALRARRLPHTLSYVTLNQGDIAAARRHAHEGLGVLQAVDLGDTSATLSKLLTDSERTSTSSCPASGEGAVTAIPRRGLKAGRLNAPGSEDAIRGLEWSRLFCAPATCTGNPAKLGQIGFHMGQQVASVGASPVGW